MRFELFLTDLPKASSSRVQSAFAELPKGASSGTVLKAIEMRKVPTVPVAWADDKRVLNEVMDTLIELGAGCKLVDHGTLAQKLVTFTAEKLGRSRYLEDDDAESRTLIKLAAGKHAETLAEALTRHALTFLLQLCLTLVLFVWYVALRVGMAGALSAPGLGTQLTACGVGLLVAYASTECTRELRAGRLGWKHALPLLLAGGVLTLASLFFLGEGSQPQLADGAVKRPPSLPYAGLLTELHRRKLAQQLDPAGVRAEAAEAKLAAEQEEEPLLWCEAPDEDPQLLACNAGPAWEDRLACLPEPAAPVRAPRLKQKRLAQAPRLAPSAPPPAQRPRAVQPPARSWELRLGLSTVLGFVALWSLSLLGLFLQQRARAAGGSAAGSPELPAVPAPAQSETAPSDELPRQLAAAHAERDALRAQLAAAQLAAEARPFAREPTTGELRGFAREPTTGELRGFAREPTTGELRGFAREPSPGDTRGAGADAGAMQLAGLQRELGLARGALGANQLALTQLKQELARANAEQASLSGEFENLKGELSLLAQQRDEARRALLEMGTRSLETGSAENDGERHTGTTRQPASADAERSGYSVNQVQEERVTLQKRRR